MPYDREGRWSPYEYDPHGRDEQIEKLEEKVLLLRLKLGEEVRDKYGSIIKEVVDRDGHVIYRVPNKPKKQ